MSDQIQYWSDTEEVRQARCSSVTTDYSQQKHTTWADNYCSIKEAYCLSCTAPVVPPLGLT